jgi:maltooligosyltrehalose trehalohydrolase
MMRVWAPNAATVDLVTPNGRTSLAPAGLGWFAAAIDLPPGTDYGFALDGGDPRPDPASRWQPHGVNGLSRIVDDDAFSWTDDRWRGFHLPGAVIYELHIGTFSTEGTFDGAIAHLDHLVALGVGAIEVMPVNAFDGDRGWGYDGVALGATHEAYGGPDGFKRFVDAAHSRGLGVILDVVYNHLGPTGAHLQEFGPYFTEGHHTPWGAGLNLDGADSDEVRRFVIENALGWLRHHHLDGLRLDAVHELADRSPTHLLAELADAVHALSAHVGRPLWLIAEDDTRDTRLVRAREAGGMGLHAVWADDLHHALHVLLTGERQGYYEGYGRVADLAAALDHVFITAPVGDLPRDRFVICSQNHDQVGNRAAGDRLVHLVGVELAKVAAAIVLLAPGTPLLFMGEEWGASTPFPYFVGERGEQLDDAVRNGRRQEFAAFGWQPDDVPDPVDPTTFEAARLLWDEPVQQPHAELLEWYRALLALRRREPDLADPRAGRANVRFDETERWLVLTRNRFEVAVNLAPVPVHVAVSGDIVLASAPTEPPSRGALSLPGGSVVVLAGLTTSARGY